MIINSSGGGGAGLNFKIVGGTTQPANPKENTIWINTDAEITGWAFSTKEPPTVSGSVWFEIGDDGLATFNALKKNSIEVNLVSVSHFVDGEWNRREWAIYQGGAWAAFGARLYLYHNGDQCETVTGGWVRKSYNNNPGTITWGEDCISFPGTTSTILINPKAFDESLIGEYTTLNAEVEIVKITDSSNPYFNLGLATNYTFSADVGSQWVARVTATEAGEHVLSLPLEGFATGKPMIGVFHMQANLKAVWLE